jgi:hypothetical protein
MYWRELELVVDGSSAKTILRPRGAVAQGGCWLCRPALLTAAG